jgi:hypothetical protein
MNQERSVLAFETVMSSYQEKVLTSGSVRNINYGSNNGGKATHTGRPCVTGPSLSDFICDVEIAARRSLSPLQYRYFRDNYQSVNLVVLSRPDQIEEGVDSRLSEHIDSYPLEQQSTIAILDGRVRRNLGAQFMRVKLFPLNIYNALVDTSRTMVRGVPIIERGGLRLVQGTKRVQVIPFTKAA